MSATGCTLFRGVSENTDQDRGRFMFIASFLTITGTQILRDIRQLSFFKNVCRIETSFTHSNIVEPRLSIWFDCPSVLYLLLALTHVNIL